MSYIITLTPNIFKAPLSESPLYWNFVRFVITDPLSPSFSPDSDIERVSGGCLKFEMDIRDQISGDPDMNR